ncbi:hypothetical protein [Roseovarius sp. MMSF_3281]|uniref:hypothetical protein n=1 Tax=Roseovarius sp. MMSF_3281 TaxID=3046694 RepID=UPI00273FBCAF|nr:hypothetical protein [Roseovarius sp. MMSF_3281]
MPFQRIMRWFRKVDGRVVFGGRGTLGAVDSPAAFRWLEHAMNKIFPDLADIPIAYRWSGQVSLTFDGQPHDLGLNAREGIPKIPFYPMRAIAVRSMTFCYEMLHTVGL